MTSNTSDQENDHHDHYEPNSNEPNSNENEPSTSDTSGRLSVASIDPDPVDKIKATVYVEEVNEELGETGEASQTVTVSEENKSLIWTLLKQVRPGMDLSKVILPTFILEPRSFLDRLSDYYYHADFLSEASIEENACDRLKKVVKWYLSGFYKKPKGLQKPYNPILGETFRCKWTHPKTNSKTYYIAEQVSHHPPVSVFYVSNRKDGFCLSGSILFKSKFYGNSLSAILEGNIVLTFLNRGEEYVITMPYAHCKGILYGTMTLELGGVVNITCKNTGYNAVVEFKLKPFLGSTGTVNCISGEIKLRKKVLALLEGHWDSQVNITDVKINVSGIFWNPTLDIRKLRLNRWTVNFDEQEVTESEKLWYRVTQAILNKDQIVATQEKFILEEAQRKAVQEREAKGEVWVPRLFKQDPITGEWHYKYADMRPWDPLTDLVQFEKGGVILTKVRRHTPLVTISKFKWNLGIQKTTDENVFSSADFDTEDSSESEVDLPTHSRKIEKVVVDLGTLQTSINSIKTTQEDIKRNMTDFGNRVTTNMPPADYIFLLENVYLIIFFIIILQFFYYFFFR